jgi:hypothetical protein
LIAAVEMQPIHTDTSMLMIIVMNTVTAIVALMAGNTGIRTIMIRRNTSMDGKSGSSRMS